jgi:hypothetical protein
MTIASAKKKDRPVLLRECRAMRASRIPRWQDAMGQAFGIAGGQCPQDS